MIIICGTPGTGKTTLARNLNSERFVVIHLTDFVKNNKLYTHFDRDVGSYVIDEEKVVKSVLEEKRAASKEGKLLLVEGVGATLLPEKEVDLCIVLKCDPAIIEQRLKDKQYPRMKIERNINAENLSVILGDAIEKFGDKCFQIDTTKLSQKAVKEKALEAINKKFQD